MYIIEEPAFIKSVTTSNKSAIKDTATVIKNMKNLGATVKNNVYTRNHHWLLGQEHHSDSTQCLSHSSIYKTFSHDHHRHQ